MAEKKTDHFKICHELKANFFGLLGGQNFQNPEHLVKMVQYTANKV